MNVKDRRYCLRLIILIRDATQKCSAASEDWNRLNDEFNTWYRSQHPERMVRSPRTGDWIPNDPVHYVGLKRPSIALNDAEAKWSHWGREVQRLAAALQSEVNIRQLLAMGESDAL